MRAFFTALWQGVLNGAQTRSKDDALQPQRYGYSSPFAQTLYWFGFEVANIVVFGARG